MLSSVRRSLCFFLVFAWYPMVLRYVGVFATRCSWCSSGEVLEGSVT